MTVKLCPRCNRRYNVMEHSGDYIHECNSGNLTLDQEDVVRIGKTVTEYGQTLTLDINSGEVMLQGTSNKLQGTYAEITGDKFGGVTSRGNNSQTHRARQHYEYIKDDCEEK